MGLLDQLKAKNPNIGTSASPAASPAIPSMPQVPANGGGISNLRKSITALAKAKGGQQRNRLPLGTGQFVLKHGAYKITDKGKHITAFTLYCVKGIVDSNNLNPTAETYSGPRAGEEYDYAVFHDGTFQDTILSKNLQIVQVCMGWTSEYVENLKKYLATGPADNDPSVQEINQIFGNTLGVDLNGEATGKPCMFSNQIIVELATKSTIKEQKDKNGQAVYDANGKKLTTTYTNTYWQKRIPLSKAVVEISENVLIDAFGSTDAVIAASVAEQQFFGGA